MKKRSAPLSLTPRVSSLLICIVTIILMIGILAMAVSPDRVSLAVGDIAPKTITATKDVEDTIATNILRENAANAVQPSYISDETVAPAVMSALREAFGQVTELATLDQAADSTVMEVTPAMIRQGATKIMPVIVEDELISAAITTDYSTLLTLSSVSQKYVRESLSGKIPEGQEAEAISKIRRDLQNEGFSDELVALSAAVITEYLKPNMLLDTETTESNRQKARDEIEPMLYKKGQNIVRSGEIVTENQIAMLNNLGMLENDSIDIWLYIGIALLVLLMSAIVIVYIVTFEPAMVAKPARIALLCVICLLTVCFSFIARNLNAYCTFVSLGAILVTLLMRPRLAITVNMVLSIFVGIIASAATDIFSTPMSSVALGALVSGPFVVAVLRKRQNRSAVLLTGVGISIINALCTISVGWISSLDMTNIFNLAMWAASGGILSAVFCIGLQPVLEWVFNLVTNAKLMELSNPNQPILRRLMLEAPGTYHHSIIVANLAEAAASAVGANALLARVGAYYHDIGKLNRPAYFRENQMGDNPHDRTDPRVSAAILLAHPKDGAEIARKGRLPESIQNIILQHHGDQTAIYFYDKALKQGLEVKPEEFSYAGPKPKEKETAIVMLADTVEAAARAMQINASREKLEELIHKLVRGKIDAGQLNECYLTFADLNKICDAFATILTGVYHERIEYPNMDIKAKPADSAKEDTKKPKKTESEDCLPEHQREGEE